MIDYQILKSGSSGNCTIIKSEIMLDAGVPYKALLPYIKTLRMVLLTHAHKDHYNESTIAALSRERPSLRFLCGNWLKNDLLKSGVFRCQIDRLNVHERATYNSDSKAISGCTIIMEPAVHNVPNCAYKIWFPNGEKLFYATDTNSLDGIRAPEYSLYLVESNYEDYEIQQRIDAKIEKGEYAYEIQARQNHLSRQKADEWLSKNKGIFSQIQYLHQHKE